MAFLKKNLFWFWDARIVFIILFVVFGIAPFLLHIFLNPFQFNQFLIQRSELRYGTITGEMLADAIRSSYSSGMRILFHNPIGKAPAFDNPSAFFDYLFSWIPPYAVVYPTEGFFYYSTSLPDVGKISGNVRVADLKKGRMSLAYFTTPGQETNILNITLEDGLKVKEYSPYSYDVTWKGKTVHFRIPQTDITFPRKLALLPEEEFFGQIHDESGIRLFLIFNHSTNSFYEVLNEEGGVVEKFTALESNPLYLLGKRTGFMFYEDKEAKRKILVGTSFANAEVNNFYDGPGDQVPIRIPIRDKLHLAYPSTLFGDGVDETGVYPGEQWARFVVAPFYEYQKPEDVIEYNKECKASDPSSTFWRCLTKEWWDTPEWRQEVMDTLRKEGKIIRRNGKDYVITGTVPL